MDGNNEHVWLKFKEDFKFFTLGVGFKKFDDEEKIGTLMNLGGDDLKGIYKTLTWAEPTEQVPDESQVYDRVVAKLDEYFQVQKNYLSSRKVFSELSQRQDEHIDQFITRIKTKVKSCDFHETSVRNSSERSMRN